MNLVFEIVCVSGGVILGPPVVGVTSHVPLKVGILIDCRKDVSILVCFLGSIE